MSSRSCMMNLSLVGLLSFKLMMNSFVGTSLHKAFVGLCPEDCLLTRQCTTTAIHHTPRTRFSDENKAGGLCVTDCSVHSLGAHHCSSTPLMADTICTCSQVVRSDHTYKGMHGALPPLNRPECYDRPVSTVMQARPSSPGQLLY